MSDTQYSHVKFLQTFELNPNVVIRKGAVARVISETVYGKVKVLRVSIQGHIFGISGDGTLYCEFTLQPHDIVKLVCLGGTKYGKVVPQFDTHNRKYQFKNVKVEWEDYTTSKIQPEALDVIHYFRSPTREK